MQRSSEAEIVGTALRALREHQPLPPPQHFSNDARRRYLVPWECGVARWGWRPKHAPGQLSVSDKDESSMWKGGGSTRGTRVAWLILPSRLAIHGRGKVSGGKVQYLESRWNSIYMNCWGAHTHPLTHRRQLFPSVTTSPHANLTHGVAN